MKIKNLIYVLFTTLIIFSCSSSGGDDMQSQPDPDPNPNPNPTPSGITYTANVRSIITNNCTNCHGSSPTQGAPFSLTTYNQVRNRVDAIISRINNGSNPMPPSGLMSSGNRNTIQQWKDDGLLE
jgi:uncharacterized membrane protein